MTEAESVTAAAEAIRESRRRGRERLGEHARYEDGVLDGYNYLVSATAGYLTDLRSDGYDLATLAAVSLMFRTALLAVAAVKSSDQEVQS